MADGKKFFNSGLDKSQGAFGICNDFVPHGNNWIAEGWATAATVAQVTGKCCLFGLDSHNIPMVIEKLRQICPEAQFRVAADHDNEGLKAVQASKVPFAGPAQEGVDWNDVLCGLGEKAVLNGLSGLKQFSDANPRKKLKHISEYDLGPPEFIIQDYVEADTLSISFVASGIAKTFIGIDMCGCISSGKAYHGHTVTQGPVGYFSGEGNKQFRKRFLAGASTTT